MLGFKICLMEPTLSKMLINATGPQTCSLKYIHPRWSTQLKIWNKCWQYGGFLNLNFIYLFLLYVRSLELTLNFYLYVGSGNWTQIIKLASSGSKCFLPFHLLSNLASPIWQFLKNNKNKKQGKLPYDAAIWFLGRSSKDS